MSPEPTNEKPGNDRTGLQIGQQSESTDPKNIEFFDAQLRQIIDIYQQADEAQRQAIFEAIDGLLGDADAK
ncbi:MAG: hypothetical protein SGI77_00645 [Pirellulaceae bacterium]|nr:hypothetical protein [Pirellulaceae bacterium]